MFAKRLTYFVLSLILVCTSIPIVASAATIPCSSASGTNIGANDYEINASPITSYLIPNGTGMIRFQADATPGGYLVEYYNQNFEVTSRRTIAKELVSFGGFAANGGYYYVLSGSDNTSESTTVTSLRITKYDSNWNVVKKLNISNINTVNPFAGGSARFAFYGNYMFIRTSHTMFSSFCDVNHQANMTLSINTSSMTLVDKQVDVSNETRGYVSHSFNQFIKVDGTNLVTVDHGDAKPRAIVLMRYPTTITSGKFVPNEGAINPVVIKKLPGNITSNKTYASVGGFEVLNDAYIVAYNYGPDGSERGVYATVVRKSDNKILKTFGKRVFDSNDAQTPHLVRISNNLCMLLWQEGSAVYYTTISNTGASGQVYSIENAYLSDCVPQIINSKVTWYTNVEDITTFYTISTSNLSTTSKKVLDNGHEYTKTSNTAKNGVYPLKCSKCGATTTTAASPQMQILWSKTENGTYESATTHQMTLGQTMYYKIQLTSNYPMVKEVKLSIPSGFIHEILSSDGLHGRITADKPGAYTFTAQYSFNTNKKITTKFGIPTPQLGDADLDGVVEAIDYILIKRAYFGNNTFNKYQMKYADVNQDGKISAMDYILTKRIYFGTYKP